MKTIKNILDKLGKPRVTIFLFVTLTLSAILIVGNLGEGKLKEITGGIGTLDLRVGYTPEQAYEALTLMGEQGRLFYRNLLIRLDLVFPLINTLFWISLITLIYKNILKKKKALYLIALFPINIFVFDITENAKLALDDDQYIILEEGEEYIVNFEERKYEFEISNVILVSKGYYIPYIYNTGSVFSSKRK